ncbi:MAG: adenylate kinase [Bacteroidales bacterium]|nr:adenylate kinase [Bacteroidales bacterium]MDD5974672.1 adenylate kinase [Bacteroidales bacterium]MDY5193140.1 adenylate kinase [Candidatus Aphodosoma sp.]
MLNIVITGAPGSGKGTQSDILVEKYGLKHISTGDLLRGEIAKGTELGMKAKTLIDAGNLVPDEIINGMLESVIKNNLDAKGFIFDGYPRTVDQAKNLDTLLSAYNEKVTIMLNIDVNHDLLIERLLNRAKTSGRADDNLETINHRLEVYQTVTLPVADYYKSTDRYHAVNNNTSIDDCFNQIKALIGEIGK